MKEDNEEFMIREKLQGLEAVVTSYKGGYEKIHKAKNKELVSEMISLFRSGADDRKIIRVVGRLTALEDIDIEFKSYINDSRKYEKRLEELQNERTDRKERDTFNRFHGG